MLQTYFQKKFAPVLALKEQDLLHKAFDNKPLQKFIIQLNQEQLMNEGVNADGTPTGDYSPASVEFFGKRPGHITLFDTGKFYESMKFKNGSGEFSIFADTLKDGMIEKMYAQNTKVFTKVYTIDLLTTRGGQWKNSIGLTDESKREIAPVVVKLIADQIRKAFKG